MLCMIWIALLLIERIMNNKETISNLPYTYICMIHWIETWSGREDQILYSPDEGRWSFYDLLYCNGHNILKKIQLSKLNTFAIGLSKYFEIVESI